MLHSIICGVDGSHASRSAARVAARLARTLNFRFVLAYVTEDRPTFPYRDARLRELQRRRAIEEGQRLLEGVAAELPGDAPELRVTFGTPVEALRALCSEESAELLVVGSRGRSPLAAAVLGSVSARLASTAECPVVVVSTSAAADRFLERETRGGSILCGVDASSESEGALHVAAALADRMALGLRPVHVSGGRRHGASGGDDGRPGRHAQPASTECRRRVDRGWLARPRSGARSRPWLRVIGARRNRSAPRPCRAAHGATGEPE